jgi:hypothetical protein
MLRARWLASILLLLPLLPSAGARQGGITPELVQRGKRATVLVEGGSGQWSGSAFCIDPAGYFVTNQHVASLRKGEEQITLVYRPGEADQKVFAATVVRMDPTADLAILRVQDRMQFTALPLGNSDLLVETTEVIAFGYPFGRQLAVTPGEYPSVTVSTGRITALRKAGGELKQIQTDASLNPGNSGGPVVNTRGEVIGIVVAGIEGAALNLAIPVRQLARLVSTPDVAFFPASIPREQAGQEIEILVRVTTFGRSEGADSLELTLRSEGSLPRTLTARSADGKSFRFRSVVLPRANPPPPAVAYKVIVRRGGQAVGEASGELRVEGRPFQIAEGGLPAGTCYNRANGHVYQAIISSTPMTWHTAWRGAQQMTYQGARGHLVTITSREEQAFVYQHFAEAFRRPHGVWLGAYQDPRAPDFREPAGGWRWVTGEPWGYTNWRAGEPNDLDGHSNWMNSFEDGSWNGTGFDDEVSGCIVEFEP